jgi:predicted transcriptional regulator
MMSKVKKNTNSPVLDFLRGTGPNPVPHEKRAISSRGRKLLAEIDKSITLQDERNAKRPEPSVEEELLAVVRLVKDNEPMIKLLRSNASLSMSELANGLGKELSNVSRTISRMAAYGLIGFESKEDGRSKVPVWLLGRFELHGGMGWLHAYCLLRCMESNKQVDCERFMSLASELEKFATKAVNEAKVHVDAKSQQLAKA